MEQVIVVTRTFQAGAGFDDGQEFNMDEFRKKLAEPLKQLTWAKNIKTIIIMVNAEKDNPLAELADEKGITPSESAIKKVLGTAVLTKKIIVKACANWGKNPGSATALNEGLALAQSILKTGFVLNWSPEIEMNDLLVERGLIQAKSHNLAVVGFLRESWWEKPQWQIPQNTATLWDIEQLLAVGGFDKDCNGTGRTVRTEEYGPVPLAGAEDFHALLRMLKELPVLRWGMVGKNEPLKWETDFLPGSEREKRHLQKVARQYQVMETWAKEIFPELTFRQVMEKLFSCCCSD
jgi:hypothetical protein